MEGIFNLMTEDAVDRIVAQWATVRPELDTTPMSVIGRIHRAAAILDGRLRPVFAQAGLGNGDFDVLATLRRHGAPYLLSPSQLSATSMVTSGAISKRLDRLEGAGLITRTVSEDDARARNIVLTPRGLALVDEAVVRHYANEDDLLEPLSDKERHQLAGLLRKLLIHLED